MLKGQESSRRTDEDATPSESRPKREPSAKRLKLFASILGLLGTVLSLAVPFVPVSYNITTLKWPTAEGTKSVSAPLVAYSPVWLNADVPCTAVRSLDARTNGPATLLSTNPPSSDYGKLTGLILQVDGGHVTLQNRGQQVGTVPLPDGDCTVSVRSDAYGTRATVGDQQLANLHGDQRPQVTGIYSGLDDKVDDVHGLSFQA